MGELPKAGWLLADRLREALKDKGIKVCIPGRRSVSTHLNLLRLNPR